MRETAAELRTAGSESTDFWIRQRASIRTRIASGSTESRRSLPRLAWAGATAILAFTGLLLSGGQAPKPVPVFPKVKIGGNDEAAKQSVRARSL